LLDALHLGHLRVGLRHPCQPLQEVNPGPVEKEKAEVRPVKPKVTIPEVIKETIAAQGKAEKEPSAEERKLGAVRLVGTGDLVLRPPRVVKKGKMKTQQEEEETKGVGALLAKLRKAGEG
jgi:hypothetical protein